MTSPDDQTRVPCSAVRADGQRCRARALPGGPLCFAHAPALSARRSAARSAGGRGRRSALRLRAMVPPELAPLAEKLETAIGALLDGTLEPRAAGALGQLARALVGLLEFGGDVLERERARERVSASPMVDLLRQMDEEDRAMAEYQAEKAGQR